MELKDKIELEIRTLDFIKNKIDLIHKKVLILLSASAGSGALIFKDFNSFFLIIGVMLLLFFSYGLFVNYKKLSNLSLDIEKLEDKVKGLSNVRD